MKFHFAVHRPASRLGALAQIYSGGKAHLRPIHDTLTEAIRQFGEFEIAPKKSYVSLRRKNSLP